MSTPRKHHYVPQVHINKFKTNTGFYVFNKKENKILNQKSSSAFFFTKDLNSIIDSDGNIDHKTFENELANKFDSPFESYYENVLSSIDRYIDSKETILEISQKTLKFFYEYGVIGRMRRLKMESSYNDNFFDFTLGFDDFLGAFDEKEFSDSVENKAELKKAKDHFSSIFNDVIEFKKKQEQLRFKGLITSGIPDLMPETLSFDVFLSEYPLILPDCTAAISKVEEKIELYGSQIDQISSVGIPLNPVVFLQIKNNNVVSNKSNSINILSLEETKELNRRISLSAFNEICSISEQILLDLFN